jgi:hypothetical protein
MLSWAFVLVVVIAALLSRGHIAAGQVGLSLMYVVFFFFFGMISLF